MEELPRLGEAAAHCQQRPLLEKRDGFDLPSGRAFEDLLAAPDPILDRCRSIPGADEQPRQSLPLLARAFGAAGVLDRVPPGLLRSGGRALPEAREPGEVPGAGETQFVSEPGEGLNCLRGDSGGLFLAAAHPDLHGGASEARLPLQTRVAGRARRLDRLPEDGIGL